MQIYIHHNGQQAGPFALEDVRAQLAAGTIQPTDMAWYQGAPEWRPIHAIPEIVSDTPPPVPGYVPPAAGMPQTSGLAITSMVLGILSFLTVGLTAIPAVICGHISRASIKKSAGALAGDGFALAGLILGYLGFAVIGGAVLAGIAVPVMMNQRTAAERALAISNAKQIGLALFAFEQEYNMFPCDETAKEVKAGNPEGGWELGNTSSNDYFRQLLTVGDIDSETPIYARIAGSRRPDNRMDGIHCLEKGECGFSYISGASSKADLPQPLVLTPLIPGTDRFDPKPFGKKAIVLWTDQSCTALPIDPSGHVIHLGCNLLDPANPVWQGKAPRVVWPE